MKQTQQKMRQRDAKRAIATTSPPHESSPTSLYLIVAEPSELTQLTCKEHYLSCHRNPPNVLPRKQNIAGAAFSAVSRQTQPRNVGCRKCRRIAAMEVAMNTGNASQGKPDVSSPSQPPAQTGPVRRMGRLMTRGGS